MKTKMKKSALTTFEFDWSILPPPLTTHFMPTDEFLDWFSNYVGDRVVMEVGAGKCDFAKKLIHRGVKTLALEPRASEEMIREFITFLLPLPVEKARCVKEVPAIVVVARPNHSGWFSILPDIIHEDSVLLYIGLKENVEEDIPDYLETKVLYKGAGEDGELVILVRRT